MRCLRCDSPSKGNFLRAVALWCYLSLLSNLRWPTTVTSNTNYSHQIQITHIKHKLLTSNTNYSHQIQITHIKYKLLTSNTNYSHQIQITHIKYKLLTSNTNRYINWSAARSMNAIPSVYSLFHFTAILYGAFLVSNSNIRSLISNMELFDLNIRSFNPNMHFFN